MARSPDFVKIKKRESRSLVTERRFKAMEKKESLHGIKIKVVQAQIRVLQNQADAYEGMKLKVAKSRKATVASILQAKGVSGSNVPEVIAIVPKYLLGHTPDNLMAPCTALDYVRDVGDFEEWIFEGQPLHRL